MLEMERMKGDMITLATQLQHAEERVAELERGGGGGRDAGCRPRSPTSRKRRLRRIPAAPRRAACASSARTSAGMTRRSPALRKCPCGSSRSLSTREAHAIQTPRAHRGAEEAKVAARGGGGERGGRAELRSRLSVQAEAARTRGSRRGDAGRDQLRRAPSQWARRWSGSTPR